MASDKKEARGKKRPAQGQERPAKKHAKGAGGDKGRSAPSKPAQPLSRKEHKEASLAKKVRFRRNFATITEAVQLWEKLRPKTTSKQEKEELVDRILGMFSGKVLELANQHTASRVIQFCLKEGGPDARAAISKEVRAHAVELARSKYGHYLVVKMINVAPKEDVPALVALFKGRVAELLRHPQGADVLTDLYDVAPQPLRNAMCAELYGREYALFEGVGGGAPLAEKVGHLRQLLESAPPAKRTAVLQHLTRCLQPVLEKALLHPPMTHRLVRELLEAAPGSVVADAVDTLAATGGSVLKMVHTHDGAAAACMALAYGTPRDRKRLVKGMKGFVWQMADNEWGNVVVATALSVVDDTALTGKAVVADIKSKLDEYLDHRHARRVLLQLLAPDSGRYCPPSVLEMMRPPRRTAMEAASKAAGGSGGGESDEEAEEGGGGKGKQKKRRRKEGGQEEEEQQQEGEGKEGEMVERVLGESKKDPAVRRAELLGAGPGGLGGALAAAVAARAGALLRSQWGCDVAGEVARGAAGGLLWESQRGGVEAVHAAIVEDAARPPPPAGEQQQKKKRKQGQEEEEEEEGDDPLLTNFFASRALRRLIAASCEEGAGGDGARAFARALWTGALRGRCKLWAGGHADKVLAALVVCGEPGVAAEAAKELAPLVGGDARAWAATHGGGPPQGGKGGGSGGKGGAAAGAKGGKKQQPQKQQQQQQAAAATAEPQLKKARRKQK